MKCKKCGGETWIKPEEVGVDRNNVPIYHRIAYCDSCMLKFDLDADEFKQDVKMKESGFGIAGLILSFFSSSVVLGITSIVLCITALRKKDKKSTCGVLGLVVCALMILSSIVEVNDSSSDVDDTKYRTEQEYVVERETQSIPKETEEEYKASCQKNGLKTLNYRLQVAKVNGVENVGVVNSQNEDSDLGERLKQLFNRKDVIKDFEKGLTQVKNGDVRTLLQQAKGRTQFIKTDKNGSHYDSSTHSVYYGKNALPGTIAHELFHEIYDTYRLLEDEFLGKSVRNDYSRLLNFAKGYGKSVEEMLYLKYPNALYINENGKIVVYEEYRGISDIIHGASDGKVDLGYGHRRPGYWSKYKALEKETFSQFGRMFYDQDEEVLKVLEELFGETYKEVIERLEGMIK